MSLWAGSIIKIVASSQPTPIRPVPFPYLKGFVAPVVLRLGVFFMFPVPCLEIGSVFGGRLSGRRQTIVFLTVKMFDSRAWPPLLTSKRRLKKPPHSMRLNFAHERQFLVSVGRARALPPVASNFARARWHCEVFDLPSLRPVQSRGRSGRI